MWQPGTCQLFPTCLTISCNGCEALRVRHRIGHRASRTFHPRLVYGDYLRSLMHQQLMFRGDSEFVTTTVLDAEAQDVTREANGAVIHLSDGSSVEADRVVLATGNQPPAGFPGRRNLPITRRGSAIPGRHGKPACRPRAALSFFSAPD